jgi:hypothetical protein
MPPIKPKIKNPIFIKRKNGINKLSKKTLTKLDAKEALEIKKINTHFATTLDANKMKIHFNKLLKAIQALKLKALKKVAPDFKNKEYINFKILELEKKINEINTEINSLQFKNAETSLKKLEEFGSIYVKYYEMLRRLEEYDFRKGIYKRK